MFDIGVDLDGCLYAFNEVFATAAVDLGYCSKEDITPVQGWDFFLDWGLNSTQFLEVCDKSVDAGYLFYEGAPYPGTLEALNRLHDSGNQIHIITDRSFGTSGVSEKLTKAWLDKFKIPYNSLTFSADKTTVWTDFMIEDKPDNFFALQGVGTRAYLLDRPWNQHCDAGRFRVHSLDEFVDKVLLDTRASVV